MIDPEEWLSDDEFLTLITEKSESYFRDVIFQWIGSHIRNYKDIDQSKMKNFVVYLVGELQVRSKEATLIRAFESLSYHIEKKNFKKWFKSDLYGQEISMNFQDWKNKVIQESYQEPQHSNQQPQRSNQDSQQQSPQQSQQQPQQSNQQPQRSNQQPQQSQQQPQQSNQQPQRSNQQPQRSNQQPQISNQQPQRSHQQPQQSNQQAQGSNQRQQQSQQQSQKSNQQPHRSNQKPQKSSHHQSYQPSNQKSEEWAFFIQDVSKIQLENFRTFSVTDRMNILKKERSNLKYF